MCPQRTLTIDVTYSFEGRQIGSGQVSQPIHPSKNTVKSRFIESRINVMSQFKMPNLVTEMEFQINKSRFNAKSQFKESKCADGGHS